MSNNARASAGQQFEEMDEEEERTAPTNTRGSDWANFLGSSLPPHERETYRDLSHDANWTLSSCKIDGDGFGISELLADSVERYWQSDGPQPHTITIELPKKTDISFVMLYLDFKSDESYTPNKVVIRLGSSLAHLDEQHEATLAEPIGWTYIDVRRGTSPTRAFVVQLQVVQNHQNGRDTHIRHMRLIGPSRSRFNSQARGMLTPGLLRPLRPMGMEGDEENGDPLKQPTHLPLLPITTGSKQLRRMTFIR